MKRIAFFLASICCLAACDSMVLDDTNRIPEAVKQPQIALVFPDAQTVNVYSTATQNENTIDSVWVLVFDKTTLARKWVEVIKGSQIAKNGFASQLLPQLKHTPDNGDSIICIANVDPVPPTDTAAVTINNIDYYYKLTSKPYYTGTAHLPMSGGFKWSLSDGNVCEMMRAVAKIQVQMGVSTGVSDVTGNFNAENVFYNIHNSRSAGFIMPKSPISAPVSVGSPTVDDFRLLQKQGVTEALASVYVYEYATSDSTVTGAYAADTEFDADRQFILLHKVNPLTSATTYYRMDFYNPATGKFFDTKRNHHYLFTIDRVRSEGYNTPAEAINNPGSNIEYTIRIDDGATRIASNGQYAIVTSLNPMYKDRNNVTPVAYVDTIRIDSPATPNEYTIGTVRYQLPDEMNNVLPAGTANSISFSMTAGSGFSLISPNPSVLLDEDREIKLLFSGPSSIGEREGVITFQLGNITYKIILKSSTYL